jgi:thiol-disulfide isomerase/thioredoxin
LEGIYGDRNNPLDWLQVAARLTEQAGIVAKIIRRREETDVLKQGVADVFAWTIAVFNSLKASGLSGDVQFADFVFDKYSNWCPKCRSIPCKCPSPIVKVFVSSVMSETGNERSAAKQTLEGEHFTPIMFEDFKGPFFFDQEAEAIRNLQESDLLLLILDRTLTLPVHTEFYSAISLGKPVLIFLKERTEPLSEELHGFLTNVGRIHKYEYFRDQDDLHHKLLAEIRKLRQ